MILILALFIFTPDVFAAETCVLTEEYKDLRMEAYDAYRKPYRACINSMSDAYYWKAVAHCITEGKGEHVGGGCGHLVSYGQYPSEDVDTSHCEAFKYSMDDVRNYFDAQVENRGVQKCKSK